MKSLTKILIAGTLLVMGIPGTSLMAETCTTQSKMTDTDRNALSAAASALAAKIQANDQAAVRSTTIAEYQKDFGGMADAIGSTSPKVKGAQAQVDSLYLLDASTLVKAPGGANPDAQFFCNLNNTANATEFSIPQLPPGRYAFAMVWMDQPAPWRLSFLMRQDAGQWLLAGFYPRALTAGGHDGLWYWKEARTLSALKEPWNSWLYLQEAQSLLLPANFISSTHLDKLSTELGTATPPAVSGGLGSDSPLVVKAPDGAEFRFTALSVDDSLGGDKPDVVAHIKVDTLGDATAARTRNVAAIAALLAAHPELRKSFHGVWLFADAPGQAPFGTELAMAEIK